MMLGGPGIVIRYGAKQVLSFRCSAPNPTAVIGCICDPTSNLLFRKSSPLLKYLDMFLSLTNMIIALSSQIVNSPQRQTDTSKP